jgi:hypothetical protein
MKKLTFLSLVLAALTATAFSIENVSLGEIAAVEGKVSVYKGNEVRGETVKKQGFKLFKNDRIKTSRLSKAYISLSDQSKIVVLEKSVLSIDDFRKLSPGEGKVIFRINKTDAAEGVQIGLQTTVIGVKGTTFLVEVDENIDGIGVPAAKVYLQEGELSFTSVEGEFKRYVEQVEEEYRNYLKETMNDYDSYIKEMTEESVEYVKEFSIKGGSAVSIDGQEVRDIEFSGDINNAFRELDRFTAEKAVKPKPRPKTEVKPETRPEPVPKREVKPEPGPAQEHKPKPDNATAPEVKP